MSDDQQARNMKAAIQQLADVAELLLDKMLTGSLLSTAVYDHLRDKLADAKELAL